MSGTKAGGVKTAQTNKKLHGKDYYVRLGVLGGKAGKGHAFAHGKVKPELAGSLGGRKAMQKRWHPTLMERIRKYV